MAIAKQKLGPAEPGSPEAPTNVTIKQAAALVGCSAWSMRELVATGQIGARKFGRRILPRYEDVRRYAENLPEARPTKTR